MNKFRFTFQMLAVAAFLLAAASISQAQATRTWVSGVGDDANPCSRTAPCKTWAGAISKTADCGEIDALDPGGFGAVTITKSITLDGTGTFASILASGTTGIFINAASDKVITIRGLSINGACTGINGINIISAKHVNIEDCVIFRFTQNGIVDSDNDGLQLDVRNTVIRDNGGDAVQITSTGGTLATAVKASFDHCSFLSSANGLHVRQGGRASARDCVFAGNGSNGIWSDGAVGGSIASVRVWSSQITENTQGVLAGLAANAGISRVELGQNQITYNSGTGVVLSTGAAVDTFGNNSILENGSNGCGGCTPVGPGS